VSDENVTYKEFVSSVVTWPDGTKTVFGNSVTSHHDVRETAFGAVDFGFSILGRLSQETIEAAKARA
jgi:hypothetical protein